MPTPDSDPNSSTISVTPLNQAASSSTETSSSVNIDAALQSESALETEINLVPSVAEVSYTSVSEPPQGEPQLPALRWTKSHPIDQILVIPTQVFRLEDNQVISASL